MRRFPVVSVLAALLAAIFLLFLAGCGGAGTPQLRPSPPSLLAPTTLSLNEGAVATISAVAQNSAGTIVAADITFTSSNPNIATVSSGGLVCGGVWDANIINCNATIGQGGVGQVTITATSGKATATATVYVHLKVDRVVVNPLAGCTSTGQVVNVTASAYSTSPPGCSQMLHPATSPAPWAPLALGSNDLTVVANSVRDRSDLLFGYAIAPPILPAGRLPVQKAKPAIYLTSALGAHPESIRFTLRLRIAQPTLPGERLLVHPGQTCSLSNFNGVTGATATVTLTGTNTIASGAHLLPRH